MRRVLIILILLSVPGRVSAEGVPAVLEEEARKKADEILAAVPLEDAELEAPIVDLTFRDPFLSFLPQDIEEQQEETEFEASWAQEDSGEIPEEEVLDTSVFEVSGLVWGIDEARAIINGSIVGVGDTIGDAKILRIDREGILFLYFDRQYLLDRGF